MPKNLGLYNNNLSIPRKKDIPSSFGLQYQSSILNNSGWKPVDSRVFKRIDCKGMNQSSVPLIIPQNTNFNNDQKKDWNKLLHVQAFDGYCQLFSSSAFISTINIIIVY